MHASSNAYSNVLLSIASLPLYTQEIIEWGSYESTKVYNDQNLALIENSYENLSSDEIKEKAENLLLEKAYIEEKIENGEVDLDSEDNGYLARLQNIYTELSLIQKILAGTGLFFLIR